MLSMRKGRATAAFITLSLLSTAISVRTHAAPEWQTRPVTDLLKGEAPFEDTSFNVGATGFRGWVFHRGVDSSESRQLLVKSVETNSPAYGVLAAGDVLLGADGRGEAPRPFTADARRSIAYSIGEAESRDPAELKLIRWRDGSSETVTLALETMGAYSSTAPYDCPKSRKILKKCAKAFYEADDPGKWSLGILVLLAVDDPGNPDNELYQAKAREWARKMIRPASEIHPNYSKAAWNQTYALVTLAEYYLKTKDKEVYPTLEAYANNYARNQSWFGTTGHQYATKRLDGGDNGPMAGYGAINGTGVAGFLGMALARKAGVRTPELAAAIERADTFFSSFAGKSGIPYGEHSYGNGRGMYDMNGKNATAALAFMLQDDAVGPTKYYAMLTAASSEDRQAGHAGPYFNYVWPPLGAAAAGQKAAAHYFKRTQWLYDLERKWDGTIVFDHFGHSPKYRGFPGAFSTLLTYALPLRQLYITGRDHDRSRWLSDNEVKALVAAEDFDGKSCDSKQLFGALSSWAPQVRLAAAKEIAERADRMEDKTPVLNALHARASAAKASAYSRNAACHALREIGDASSAPLLADLLGDSESYVRYGAAHALRYLPRDAVMEQLEKILTAAAATVRPAFPLVKGDPIQFAHHQIAMLLFYDGNAYGPKGILSQSIEGVDRKLLWPAVRAVAKTPSGQGRSTVGSVYRQLTREEMLELADTIVESVKVVAPADAMFAGGVRMKGADLLEKYDVAEGIPLVEAYADRLDRHYPKILEAYGGSVLASDSDIMQFIYDQWLVRGADLSGLVEKIVTDPKPRRLALLKKIDSVVSDKPVVKLPAKDVTLRVRATNYAVSEEQSTIYTWRKVYGAGAVKFSPNGSWAANKTLVEFVDKKPGKYRFEVTMSDRLGYTTVKDTVDVELHKRWGELPRNKPPEADSKVMVASPGIPAGITLTGNDPDKEDLAFILTGKPSHGVLAGTPPDLRYTAKLGYSGKDSFTFKVIDGQGAGADGSVTVSVIPAKTGLSVYEGFDCGPGLLNEQAGKSSVGLIGKWTADGPRYKVVEGSFSCAKLPVTGSKLQSPGWGRQPQAFCAVDKAALSRDGVLANGRELWFSIVIGANEGINRTNGSLDFGLKDSSGNTNTVVGMRLARSAVHAAAGVQIGDTRMGTRSGNVTMPVGQPALYVGRCAWGATDDDEDTVEVYRVADVPGIGPVMLKSPVSAVTGTVRQQDLDTLYFGYNEKFIIDELRVGPTYESVLLGTVALSEVAGSK